MCFHHVPFKFQMGSLQVLNLFPKFPMCSSTWCLDFIFLLSFGFWGAKLGNPRMRFSNWAHQLISFPPTGCPLKPMLWGQGIWAIGYDYCLWLWLLILDIYTKAMTARAIGYWLLLAIAMVIAGDYGYHALVILGFNLRF